MRLRTSWLVALAVTAVVAVGCGDDDEETTTAATGEETSTAATGEPSTKEEFIAQADQICAEGDQQIDAAAGETFTEGDPTPEEEEQFITETVLPNIQGQIDSLRALTPPEGDEKEVGEILDAAQAGIDETEEDPTSLTQEGEGDDAFAEASRLAADYGLEDRGS
jgi:hypothetical protein